MKIIDKFDGWKIFDNELLKERRMQMRSPYSKKKTMAKILDIDLNLIKSYEDLKRFPSLSTFKKLCLYLQISADELLGIEVVKDSNEKS